MCMCRNATLWMVLSEDAEVLFCSQCCTFYRRTLVTTDAAGAEVWLNEPAVDNAPLNLVRYRK